MEVGRPPLRKSFTKKGFRIVSQAIGNCSLSSTVGRKNRFLCTLCKKPAFISLVKDEHFCWSSSCLFGEIKETIAGGILAAKGLQTANLCALS